MLVLVGQWLVDHTDDPLYCLEVVDILHPHEADLTYSFLYILNLR